MSEALAEIREGFSKKEIKMAIGVASDPRYKQGNYTGAVNAIEKIKKGLSKHPQVAAVLKRKNEKLDQEDEPFVKDLVKNLRKGSATHSKQADDLEKAVKEDVELDEKYDLYHKTFSDAMQHAYDYAKKKLGITVDPKEIDNKVATGPKKPSEGKTNKYRLKGKGGNLQIQVYNKGGSKPFELNMYKEENEMSDKLTDGNLSLKETVMKMWQEAKSPEQQAAIAIAKKEKEKKEEPDEGNLFTKALKDARDKGEKTFTVAGKTYDVKSEKLVGGQKKLDKDKDGDIDAKDFAMLRKSKKKDNTEAFE